MVGSLLKLLTKRRSQTFYEPLDVHSVMNFVGKSISSISMLNIVEYHLGKHDFSCGYAVNNLKVRKVFSDQMNRNRLD